MSARGPDPSSARQIPFFDQGLFLLHLNRGKVELRRGSYDLARRELEAAQHLRPRDPEVLANLSLTLFHLGHFEEAEEITRELLRAHPSSLPLVFNLALILFKAGRHDEAREPLEKVLELDPRHRKAHLTYGLLLQKLGDVEEAKVHLKLARAGLASEEDDTVARAAKHAERGAEAGEEVEIRTSPVVKPEGVDTRSAAPVLPLEPERTQRAAAEPAEVITAEVRIRTEPAPAVPKAAPAVPAPSPHGPFTVRPGGFLAADCSAPVFVRRGALTGRTGALSLETEAGLAGVAGQLLIKAVGEGSLLLVDRGRHPHLVALADQFVSVEPSRILGFEAALTFREDPAFEFRRVIKVPYLKLFGRGVVALSVAAEPARFEVTPGEPVTLAARAVVAYGGEAIPELLEESDPIAELGAGPVLRFTGTGYVLADGS